MGATILSLDSTGKEGPPTHHGGLHSLIGFSENEGLPTHHGSIHSLIGFNEKGGPPTHHGRIHSLIGFNEKGGGSRAWEHSFSHWIQ